MEGGIYEKMSTYLGTLARFTHTFTLENALDILIFQNGVADMLRSAKFIQQHQAAGGEDHQVHHLLTY